MRSQLLLALLEAPGDAVVPADAADLRALASRLLRAVSPWVWSVWRPLMHLFPLHHHRHSGARLVRQHFPCSSMPAVWRAPSLALARTQPGPAALGASDAGAAAAGPSGADAVQAPRPAATGSVHTGHGRHRGGGDGVSACCQAAHRAAGCRAPVAARWRSISASGCRCRRWRRCTADLEPAAGRRALLLPAGAIIAALAPEPAGAASRRRWLTTGARRECAAAGVDTGDRRVAT